MDMGTPDLVVLILLIYGGAIAIVGKIAKNRIKNIQDTIAAPGQSNILLLIGSAVGMHIGSGFLVGAGLCITVIQ